MGLIKIFSGTEILAQSLQQKIEAIGVTTVIRINNQANVIPSIQTNKAVELFIQEVDFGKADNCSTTDHRARTATPNSNRLGYFGDDREIPRRHEGRSGCR